MTKIVSTHLPPRIALPVPAAGTSGEASSRLRGPGEPAAASLPAPARHRYDPDDPHYHPWHAGPSPPAPPRAPGDSGPSTPEFERERILARQLSPVIAGWVDAYGAVGKRNLYLWKWCSRGVELTTLPCVPPHLHADACDTKVLSGMLNVLLDDVADQGGQGPLLGELLKLVHGASPDFSRLSAGQRAYGRFTRRVWREYWRRARRLPCFAVYHNLLRYDLAQLFNTVHYSHLVNQNLSLLNLVEHDQYSPPGMMLMSFATLDLMCTPRFQSSELGTLREAVWHAQWMARIGNLVSTWQREIGDRDYTSGVFARAVVMGHLSLEQLANPDARQIEGAIRAGRHEEHFLCRWQYHRTCLETLRPQIRSFDLAVWLERLGRLLNTELGSCGLK